jgi:hypothetical protein
VVVDHPLDALSTPTPAVSPVNPHSQTDSPSAFRNLTGLIDDKVVINPGQRML